MHTNLTQEPTPSLLNPSPIILRMLKLLRTLLLDFKLIIVADYHIVVLLHLPRRSGAIQHRHESDANLA